MKYLIHYTANGQLMANIGEIETPLMEFAQFEAMEDTLSEIEGAEIEILSATLLPEKA